MFISLKFAVPSIHSDIMNGLFGNVSIIRDAKNLTS